MTNDWKKRNPERAKAYEQAYLEAHREERRAYHARRRAEQPEKVRALGKAQWLKHREKRTAALREQWIRLRAEVLTRYGGHPPACACCGERTPGFLGLDHPNGDGAAHRRAVGPGRVYWELKKQGWPEGYRVLCHNCNLARGFYGACPHDDPLVGDPSLPEGAGRYGNKPRTGPRRLDGGGARVHVPRAAPEGPS